MMVEVINLKGPEMNAIVDQVNVAFWSRAYNYFSLVRVWVPIFAGIPHFLYGFPYLKEHPVISEST
jgi:hypothetical protein